MKMVGDRVGNIVENRGFLRVFRGFTKVLSENEGT